MGGCHVLTAEFYLQMGMNISLVIINTFAFTVKDLQELLSSIG